MKSGSTPRCNSARSATRRASTHGCEPERSGRSPGSMPPTSLPPTPMFESPGRVLARGRGRGNTARDRDHRPPTPDRSRAEQLPPALDRRRAVELAGLRAAAPAHRERLLRIGMQLRERARERLRVLRRDREPRPAQRARAPPPRRGQPRSRACPRRAPRTAWLEARPRRSRRSRSGTTPASAASYRLGIRSEATAPSSLTFERPSVSDLVAKRHRVRPLAGDRQLDDLWSRQRSRLHQRAHALGHSERARIQHAQRRVRPPAGSGVPTQSAPRSTAGGTWITLPARLRTVAQARRRSPSSGR